MATLREYFDLDFNRTGSWFTDVTMSSPSETVVARFRVHYDFDSGAKFISCFVPYVKEPAGFLLSLFRDFQGYLQQQSDDVEMAIVQGHSNRVEADVRVAVGQLSAGRLLSSRSFPFTGRFVMYYDDLISTELDNVLYEEAGTHNLLFEIRTPAWATRRQSVEQPLAFICHDSGDKDEIARPLAIELSKLACPVWFDEFTLQMGDSLRESIEKGLKESKKCILVITPNFLTNQRWTKREFASIFTREVMKNEKLVLPIWHSVTAEQVYEYSPSLADRVARHWTTGNEQALAHEIRRIVLAV